MAEYIEREAALRDWPPCDEPADAYQFIRNYPAADVRPVVRGRWIMPNADGTDRPMPECSHCGWYVDYGGVKDFSFCPNCGALMDKDGDADV